LDLAGQFQLQQACQNKAWGLARLFGELIYREINGIGELPNF
jgi:hypothetical protein